MLPIHTRVVARPDRLRLFSTSKSVSKRKRSQVLGGRYAPKNRWKFKILAGIHNPGIQKKFCLRKFKNQNFKLNKFRSNSGKWPTLHKRVQIKMYQPKPKDRP